MRFYGSVLQKIILEDKEKHQAASIQLHLSLAKSQILLQKQEMQENQDEIKKLRKNKEDQGRMINELQSRIQVQNSELTGLRIRKQGQSNQVQSQQQGHHRMLGRLQKLENKINIFEFTNEFTFKVENFSQELQNAVADRATVKYFTRSKDTESKSLCI